MSSRRQHSESIVLSINTVIGFIYNSTAIERLIGERAHFPKPPLILPSCICERARAHFNILLFGLDKWRTLHWQTSRVRSHAAVTLRTDNCTRGTR